MLLSRRLGTSKTFSRTWSKLPVFSADGSEVDSKIQIEGGAPLRFLEVEHQDRLGLGEPPRSLLPERYETNPYAPLIAQKVLQGNSSFPNTAFESTMSRRAAINSSANNHRAGVASIPAVEQLTGGAYCS